jgi:hypothetical protein
VSHSAETKMNRSKEKHLLEVLQELGKFSRSGW